LSNIDQFVHVINIFGVSIETGCIAVKNNVLMGLFF